MTECEKCGAKLKENSKFCTKCGHKEEKKEAHKENNSEHKKKFCKKCGHQLSESGKFCPECGHHKHKKHKKKNYKKIVKWIVIILVAALVIGGGFLAVNNFMNKGRPTTTEGVTQKPSVIEKVIKKAYCGNKACESGEDSSNCCVDCGCPDGYSCDGTKCKKLASCGNNVCEEGESSSNCCKDCGCPTGENCENNVCVVLKPEISATFTQTTDSYSVTFLKARGDNVGTIYLSNSGNDIAKNIQVVLSSPNKYFSDKTINAGSISNNGQNTKTIDLNFLEKALDVTTDEDITIKAMITFSNSANKKFTSEESFKMHIAGRNYMTWGMPKMIASWVTPTQPTIREFSSKATSGLAAGMSDSDPTVQKMAARWLFESMRSYGVKYVNDAHSSADYIQFPFETLKNKAGDCDDNAVLYASLLESIGLKSFLVLVPGHIFSGYISSDGYAVPIETTASNFDYALSSGSSQYQQYKNSKEVIYPTSSWNSYPQVNLPESSLNMPSITKQKGDCSLSFSWDEGVIVKMPVVFTNSGSAPGAGCAAIIVYSNGNKIEGDLNCWTINPGESKQFDYTADISLGSAITGYSCAGY